MPYHYTLSIIIAHIGSRTLCYNDQNDNLSTFYACMQTILDEGDDVRTAGACDHNSWIIPRSITQGTQYIFANRMGL